MGKISDYANVLKSKLTDLFVVYQRNDGELETKNATLEQLGDAICGEQVHADLETDDQTIIGGINENKDKVGSLSTLTTTDKSSLVGAVNEVDGKLGNKADSSDVYTKTQIDSVSTATVPATVGSGNVYYKVFGNLVIVWGLINTVSGIATGQAIITGLPRNMIGANNVIKAINNDGTSADWVLYQPNGNTSMLSSIAHTGTKSYTISFSYYTN